MDTTTLDPITFSIEDANGEVVYEYRATPKQQEFHQCQATHCILEGSRGTGKSVAIRNDAHMRAMQVPGSAYLILRRTMPALRSSHLRFVPGEMDKLGGRFNKTESIAYYPNGSQVFYSHCETEEDMMRLLSAEFTGIYFDEITTFTQEQITKISTCARVPDGSGLVALIRGGTNPVGVGADYVNRYYITKDVDEVEDDQYDPNDYVAIHTVLTDNKHLDQEQYKKQFVGLPAHIRDAWLEGIWATEGAYFDDFAPDKNGAPWHRIKTLPIVEGKHIFDIPWIRVYRAVDWGFFPDPAVCLWIAILPNGREIAFRERTWYRTTAADVARGIKEDSEGLRVAETFCDPTMFVNSEATGHSVGDIFEMNGVPLTKSMNDRRAAGYAIHEHLNTLMEDGLPKLQIWHPDKYKGCFMLMKTIPMLRRDENDPSKIADGQDHWAIALAYYCMSLIGPSQADITHSVMPWMRPKPHKQQVLGSGSVRSRR